MKPKEIIDYIWHDLYEDALDKNIEPDRQAWEFCAGILKTNKVADMSGGELKKMFINYFKELTGIAPYTVCPKSNKQIPHYLMARKSDYGYFVGCSIYPLCDFHKYPVT